MKFCVPSRQAHQERHLIDVAKKQGRFCTPTASKPILCGGRTSGMPSFLAWHSSFIRLSLRALSAGFRNLQIRTPARMIAIATRRLDIAIQSSGYLLLISSFHATSRCRAITHQPSVQRLPESAGPYVRLASRSRVAPTPAHQSGPAQPAPGRRRTQRSALVSGCRA